ncbi:F420-dependent NADP oxidoreductase [Larkinella harenae]
MKLSFIGAGNLAWHLAIALENAGHFICEVYSRTPNHAQQLISMLYDAQLSLDLNYAESEAELFILAVPDDAIDEVTAQLVLPENAAVVHTSGSKSLETLRRLMDIYSDVPVRTGVFYPLQTFSRTTTPLPFEAIPLCIEASDAETETQLVTLAQEISQVVYLISSHERKVLHIAAVFACNFTNYLLGAAKDLTDSEDLEFDLLRPLIEETIEKALYSDHPARVQTGPARRGDVKTLGLHLDYLADKPALSHLYRLLSDGIQQRNMLL